MIEFREIRRALFRTGDGASVLVWALIFAVLLVKSALTEEFSLNQLRFLAFPSILFAIFCRFRVSDFSTELRTNMWGFANINCFGLFLIYLEFFK
jgi:hypothetical protein